MTITYWIADCLRDSKVYSIRERTRKAVVAKLNEAGTPEWVARNYGKPRKVTVGYTDGFDLLKRCTEEGGLYEGRVSSAYDDKESE